MEYGKLYILKSGMWVTETLCILDFAEFCIPSYSIFKTIWNDRTQPKLKTHQMILVKYSTIMDVLQYLWMLLLIRFLVNEIEFTLTRPSAGISVTLCPLMAEFLIYDDHKLNDPKPGLTTSLGVMYEGFKKFWAGYLGHNFWWKSAAGPIY